MAKYRSRLCPLFGKPHCHAISVECPFAVDLKLDLDLQQTISHNSQKIKAGRLTSQLVAVNGKREKSQPSCDGRSDVRRIYLEEI